MSNLPNTITFEGLEDQKIPEEMQKFARDLVARLEIFRSSLMNSLRSEPTVFHANPDVDLESVEGAKAGDVAVWVDGAGVTQVKVLGLS